MSTPSFMERTFASLTREAKRVWVREHKKQCATFPESMQLQETPSSMMDRVINTWQSRHHLAVAWKEPKRPELLCRLTINRTYINEDTGAWLDGISWDDLFRIKNECGFGSYEAIEVYPVVEKLVNVANMRHLWVLREPTGIDLGESSQ